MCKLLLHDSTIIALEDIIRVANIPEEQRKGLISKLRELPADAIKHLTLQLLTPAVLHPQAVIQSIEKFPDFVNSSSGRIIEKRPQPTNGLKSTQKSA
jgi:hypothetical protein